MVGEALAFLATEFLEAVDMLFELANDQERSVVSDQPRIIDRDFGKALIASRDREQTIGVMERIERRPGRHVAAVVGVAENELARLDEVNRVIVAQAAIGAADGRLRNAIDKTERLAPLAQRVRNLRQRKGVSDGRAMLGGKRLHLGRQPAD